MLSLGFQYQTLILPDTENAGKLFCLILLSSYYIGGHPLPTPHEGAKGGRGGVLFISISQNKGQFFSLHILSYLITSDILPITDYKDGTAMPLKVRIWAGSKSLGSVTCGGCAVVCVRHPGRVFLRVCQRGSPPTGVFSSGCGKNRLGAESSPSSKWALWNLPLKDAGSGLLGCPPLLRTPVFLNLFCGIAE